MDNREITDLIAKRIMHWHLDEVHGSYMAAENEYTRNDFYDWLPAEDIRAAWEVVDKVCGYQYDYIFRLERLTGRAAPGRWRAQFEYGIGKYSGKCEGYALDAPMAICIAALRTLGIVVLVERR